MVALVDDGAGDRLDPDGLVGAVGALDAVGDLDRRVGDDLVEAVDLDAVDLLGGFVLGGVGAAGGAVPVGVGLLLDVEGPLVLQALDLARPSGGRYFGSLTAIAVTRSVAKYSTLAVISRSSGSSADTQSGTSSRSKTRQLELTKETTSSSDLAESARVIWVPLTGSAESAPSAASPAARVTESTSMGVFISCPGA